MRANILFVLVISFVPFAVARPKWGLLGYIFFALCRPDILAWAVSDRLSLIIAAATLVGSVVRLERWFAQLRNPFVLLLLLLIVFSLFSSVLAVVPSAAYPRFNQFFRSCVMAVAIPVLVSTETDLADIMLAIVAGLGVIGIKFGLYSLLGGGVRYASGYGGMMADNNTMALGLVMAVPLAFYSVGLAKKAWIRLALLGVMFFLVTTTIMTYSRGAALSLGFVAILMIRGSKYKVAGVVVLVLLSIPAMFLAGSSYFDRVQSIGNYDSDNSIVGRLNNARAAIEMWKDHPLHGVGFGMVNQQLLWPTYVRSDEIGSGLVVHNTYLQLLTDSGILGFLAYVILLFSAIWWTGRSAKLTRRIWPGKELFPRAIQASLIGCAIGTTFLSRVDFDLTYIVLMCAAAWWSLMREKRTQLQREQRTVVTAQVIEVPVRLPAGRRWARPRPALGR